MKQIKKKWADIRSRGLNKSVRNRSQTGNMAVEVLTYFEKDVIDFIDSKDSYLVAGIPGAVDTGSKRVLNRIKKVTNAQPPQSPMFTPHTTPHMSPY
jgi:hypothetical protein